MNDNNITPEFVAKEWLKAYFSDPSRLSDDHISDILGLTQGIIKGPEAGFWRFVDLIVSAARTEYQIANFGCGPLECYLQNYAGSVEELEKRIVQGGTFFKMLQLVDTSECRSLSVQFFLDKLSGRLPDAKI